MSTEFDPNIHREVLTDQNGRVISHKFDPDANGGEGGFVAVGKNNPMEVKQTGDVATETTLSNIDGKDFATETTLSTIEGKDFATETTLETLKNRMTNQIGTYGNLWDNELVEYNGESNIIDTQNLPHISIMLNAYSDEDNDTPANVTIEFLASADGEHFTFCSKITENLPQGGTSEAHIFETIGARYIKIRRADDDTESDLYITGSLQAKP